jgi:hypothetical protein
MRGFWNDAEGLTVVEILALAFGLASIAGYLWFREMDTNWADIMIGALIAVAGQKVGVGLVGRRKGVGEVGEGFSSVTPDTTAKSGGTNQTGQGSWV